MGVARNIAKFRFCSSGPLLEPRSTARKPYKRVALPQRFGHTCAYRGDRPAPRGRRAAAHLAGLAEEIRIAVERASSAAVSQSPWLCALTLCRPAASFACTICDAWLVPPLSPAPGLPSLRLLDAAPKRLSTARRRSPGGSRSGVERLQEEGARCFASPHLVRRAT